MRDVSRARPDVDHDAAPLIAVHGLAKRYGACIALDDLSLTVRPGEVFGLLGGNGGGKTTTLRILAGLLSADAGAGVVMSCDVRRGSARIREQVGYMSQRLSLYGDLSAFENLRFRAQVHGAHRPGEAAEAAIREFGLDDHARTPAGRLSGGWARRLQLAAAMIHRPALLLLDEPTAALDAAARHEVWRRIARTAALGVGIVVSTHDLAEADWCTRVAFMSAGRVVAAGTPSQVAEQLPARVFALEGAALDRLADEVRAVADVLAVYPRGAGLRVVAHGSAETALTAWADRRGVHLVAARAELEDTALALAAPARS